MKFIYTVIYKGKIVGKKSCIAPSIEAFEYFIQDKVMRHLRIGTSHDCATGFTFRTEHFEIAG